MGQRFTGASAMVKQMKKDLYNRTFPDILDALSSATHLKLEGTFSSVAAAHNGKPPKITVTVSTIPSPGSAVVRSVVSSSETPAQGQVSQDEADAYRDAVRKFYTDHVNGKALVLKLLASAGVT